MKLIIVKIVGFKVGRDRSTCYYKCKFEEDVWNAEDLKELEKTLGHYMRLALDKSDFVSVRK